MPKIYRQFRTLYSLSHKCLALNHSVLQWQLFSLEIEELRGEKLTDELLSGLNQSLNYFYLN